MSTTTTTNNITSPPLVWVTVGKTQHAAFLLDANSDDGNLVRWASTQKTEWIDSDDILLELSPRRRRRRQQREYLETSNESPSPPKRHRKSPKKRSSARNTTANSSSSSDTESSPTQPLDQPIEPDYSEADIGDSAGSTSKALDNNEPLLFEAAPSDSNNDSDIELLFSIRPPTPKRPRSAEQKQQPSSSLLKQQQQPTEQKPSAPAVITASSSNDESSSSIAARSLTSFSAGIDSEPVMTGVADGSECSSSDQQVTTATVDAMSVAFVSNKTTRVATTSVAAAIAVDTKDKTPAAPVLVEYTLTSSAYVQNLAEMCFCIMQDRRWRTGGNALQALFQWECGQDLSAVTLLSRQFVQPPDSSRQEQRKKKRDFQCTCLLCQDKKSIPSVKECNVEEEMPSPVDDSPLPTLDEEEAERCLYLYCRLFYRKGPWFRLGDVYSRYYAPKEKALLSPEQQESTGKAATAATKESPTPSKENFFRPNVGVSNQSKKGAAPEALIDRALLKQYVARMSQLLNDLARLQRTGLIRGFASEEECGKTVGVTVLTLDERSSVLSKLGGGKKANNNKTAGASGRPSKENKIWQHMNQQQQILFAKTKTSEKRVLPVAKHVDETLLNKLARSIVQSCCRTEYVPAPVMRAHLPFVLAAFRETVGRLPQDTPRLGLCIRLREAPLLTLQRCLRLYLCAESGPGEMRGNGTNGWRSLVDVQANPPLARTLPPPSLQSWNQVSYPGLMCRFGVSSSSFVDAYNSLPVPNPNDRVAVCVSEQIFPSKLAFLAWESCVELRANVDYLIELTDTLRYEERKRARGAYTAGSGEMPGVDGVDSVDFLQLLTPLGRKKCLDDLLSACCEEDPTAHATELGKDIDRQVDTIDTLEDECARILGMIAVLATSVLCFRSQTIPNAELVSMSARPWLRHTWFEGCLAYILWDIIPVLERRGLYLLALQSLRTLLYGSTAKQIDGVASFVLPVSETTSASTLPSLLLSRRARGKAYDRVIIDYTHMLRKEAKESSDTADKTTAVVDVQPRITHFCKSILGRVVQSSSIGFSAIRGLARRLKRPLGDTLRDLPSLEATELGLRLGDASLKEATEQASCYSDWTPHTDTATANAINADENEPGGRCAFVGFEDEAGTSSNTSSLNVEELALEYYNSGRLPNTADSGVLLGGGWVGWHDEGGHVRALFRIFCAAPLLGMDWGCAHEAVQEMERKDHATIHLSPYQGAPFDLHVGFELQETDHEQMSDAPASTNGFYFRRRQRIETFLTKLAKLSGQELCDAAHASITARTRFMTSNGRKDPSLERDLEQLRTLSFMAAGCGGPLLAAVFRCFLFDYRHYSGGLPDLTLVRATYEDTQRVPDGLVDLGAWVGEGFDAKKNEEKALHRGAAMLADRDDEFLGCSKVGDSGGQNRFSRSRSSQSLNPKKQSKALSMDDLPDKLDLVYEGRRVKVECMMVEVKSSNDRLDARQEDWLNILDLHGNARVCKFEDNSKSKKKKKAPKQKAAKAEAKTEQA